MDSFVLRVKESEYHKKYFKCFFKTLIVKDDFKPTVLLFNYIILVMYICDVNSEYLHG